MARAKPSQIFALVRDSEIKMQREPEAAASLMERAVRDFKAAIAGRPANSKETFLNGLAHQADLNSAKEFTQRYPAFN